MLFAWPIALAYCYPDGRLPSRRWRPVAALAAVATAGVLLLSPLAPTLERGDLTVASPLGIDVGFLEPVFWVCWGGLVLALVGGVAALVARFRAGGPDERRQILWLPYGFVVLPLWLGGVSLWEEVIGEVPDADVPVLLIPHVWLAVAVAIAVTRHGLYAIDSLVNRTLVYGLLTALLAGTYAVVALLAGRLAGDSALAASAGTLAAALAFRPLRGRLQDGVDRRFARARYEGVRHAARVPRRRPRRPRRARGRRRRAGARARRPARRGAVPPARDGRVADRGGQLVDALPEDGRERTVLGRDRELGLLLHDPASRPDSAVLDAAAVAVELGRLRVELRLQLAEVESSRARIAQAGYAERRRIERDLHDGAQQRLVTLGIVLRRLQRSLTGEREGARAGVRLRGRRGGRHDRRPAHDRGRRPPAPARRRPGRRAGGPRARLGGRGRRACERRPRAARGGGGRLLHRLRGGHQRGQARVALARHRRGDADRPAAAPRGRRRRRRRRGAPPSGRGLAGLADRVAAQGGTLALESPSGAGTRIAVELPCAS